MKRITFLGILLLCFVLSSNAQNTQMNDAKYDPQEEPVDIAELLQRMNMQGTSPVTEVPYSFTQRERAYLKRHFSQTGNRSALAIDYTLDQTGTFNPIDISATGTEVMLGDDDGTGAIAMGFTFNFIGNDYTDIYISSNGYLTFDPADVTDLSDDAIPDPNMPNDIIAVAWDDLDPGNGGQPAMNVVRYSTEGTAPNRVFVVEYFNVDQFPSGNNVTTQAQLYEGTNVIEIHTTTKPSDGGTTTQGIENFDGSDGLAVPGRNAQDWTAMNDFVSFTPNGGGGGGCGAVTYSNVSPTGNGAPSQLFPDFGNEGGESADDFQLSLPPMTEATLCEISVTGTGAGIPLDPANEIILNLYNDAGGAPGGLIFTETFDGPATDPGGTGSFTLTPSGTPTLQDGTIYWVSVVVSMEFGASGQWFWSTADDGNDNEFHWQDPTDLFGLGTCPTWGPGGTVCGVAGGSGPDLLMDLSFEEIPIVDNDTCATAFSVACGDVVLSETTTNTDTGGNPAPDEWYSFTGSGSPQVVTVSLCGPATDYDSLLRIYDACGGTEIAFNDDACGLQSEVSFLSDGTSTYYIMVEGFASNSGNFEMAITCVDPPPNDECAGALDISCGETVVGETDTATFDASAPVCVTGITAPGVWYTFEDTSGLITDYTLSLCDGGTDYDSKLTVYSGDCGALVCVVDNDDTCGLQSEVSWQGDGSTTYYILVHGFGGATGNFSMELSCTPVPPPNDMIVNSIDVDEIGFPYTDPAVAMPAATLENGNPTGCNIDGGKGVWYNFVSAGNGTATAEIVSPAGASFVVFFTAPDEMAMETDLEYFFQIGNQCAPGTSANINTAAGQAYYVFVVNDGGVTDIVIDGTLLSTDENFIQGFSYYPNPTDDTLNLSSVESIEDVAIYNLLGQQVISQDVNATSLQLDTSSLATGAYLMKVTVNGQTGTYKVIKR